MREVKIKNEIYQMKVKERKEKEIYEFYNNLRDYEVGERIKRSYRYLNNFLRNRKKKNPIIPIKKWTEELLKSSGPLMNIPEDREELTSAPTKLEREEIIRKLANGKAAGKDGLRNEYLKYATDEIIDELWLIIKKVWETNELPKQWKEGLQIPIPKKKTPKETSDYRRITLSSVGYKIYASWLVNRLIEYAGLPGYHQAAFINNRSTDDQMFYVRRHLEAHWNKGERIIVASLDLRKAFDTVKLESVEGILLELGVPTHLINRVRQAMNGELSSILWEGIETEKVLKGIGIKQGCPMSPYIFVLIIQKILIEVQKKYPSLKLLELGRQGLPVAIAFADDILLISKSIKDLDRIVKLLKEELSKVGLELNPKKSKILIREPLRSRAVPDQVIVDGDSLEVVNTMRYLGTFLTGTLDRPNTTRIRCRQAVNSARVVIEFVRKFKPSWDIAKLIYMTVISPAITYGLKGAALVKRNRKSIARYELQIIKELLKYCRNRPRGRIRVSRLLNGKSAVNRIREMQMKF